MTVKECHFKTFLKFSVKEALVLWPGHSDRTNFWPISIEENFREGK
jgi:hypothetical protein